MYSYLMASARATPRKRWGDIYEDCKGFIPLINYRPKGHYSLNVCRGNWTADEDRKVNELQALHGNKWTLIMSFLPGRSKYSCRNRWHIINKAKNSKTLHKPHSTAAIPATQNVAKRVTTSKRIPTHKLFNAKIINAQDPHPNKPISATQSLGSANVGESKLLVTQDTNNENGPRSLESTSVSRSAANANTNKPEPVIVVPKKEVMTASKVETRNISNPDEILSEAIHRLSPLVHHSVNQLKEDLPNHEVTIQSSPLPKYDSMTIHDALPEYDSMTIPDAEGEEQSSIDDPSFAYAVTFAASLINAEDNSWLLNNFSDGYESEDSGDALVDSS